MTFQELLDNVAETIPAYRRSIFKAVVIGLLVRNGSGRISAIFRHFAGVFTGGNITRKRFYTFLNSGKIKWSAIWHRLAELLGSFVAVDGRLLTALDDTTYGKTGKKINGCGIHHDHSAKQNASRWVFGHCRVLVGILLKRHGRWACLPMGQQNFVSAKKNRQKPEKADWHKTKNGIAANLLCFVVRLFNLPVLIICDSWFGNCRLLQEMRKALGEENVNMLSRLRVSCALFTMPEKKEKPGRGRPRKYGRRLPDVRTLAADMRADARTEKVFIYGRERDCTYSELTCMSRAWKCMVKVVFVYRASGTVFPLVTSDPTLTAPQMIEYYAARWKIESGFKELKHEIGALDSQCRNENAVENHFNLCCLSMTLGWIYALNRSEAPKRLHPDRRSGAFAFADIRRAIAAELGSTPIFDKGCPESVKRAIKYVREALFRPAA